MHIKTFAVCVFFFNRYIILFYVEMFSSVPCIVYLSSEIIFLFVVLQVSGDMGLFA